MTEAGYSGHFNNGGEEVTLSDPDGGVIEDFTYTNSWYPQTDGGGFALVPQSVTEAASLWNSSSGWEASGTLNGTPGIADPVTIPLPGAVVINQVLANPTGAPGDIIELANTTSQSISIGTWFLSDSGSNLTMYQIPAGATIAANGYYVLTQNNNFGFTLDPDGSTVYLSNNYDGQAGGYQESQNVNAMPPGYSYGLYTKLDGGTSYSITGIVAQWHDGHGYAGQREHHPPEWRPDLHRRGHPVPIRRRFHHRQRGREFLCRRRLLSPIR